MKNTYKVPAKQWNKWSAKARAVFELVYRQLDENPGFFMHPKASEVPAKHWSTTAWNTAWVAADAVDEVNSVEVRS